MIRAGARFPAVPHRRPGACRQSVRDLARPGGYLHAPEV